MKKLDPVRIIETIEMLGVRKSIKYAFIGSGCILVVVVPVCCVVTFIKSHAKTKEQNNASANKQWEIERTSGCKKGEEDNYTMIQWFTVQNAEVECIAKMQGNAR